MGRRPRIAIIGGDRRELVLAEHLQKMGFDISLCGFGKGMLAAEYFSSPIEAARGAQAIILPMAGVKKDLTVHSPANANPPKVDGAFFKSLPAETPVFIGWASKELKELFGGARLIEVVNDDELAVLNSIPTAEGAIAIAMNEAPVTLHGNNAMVVGFGRCGSSLARMLGGIGAQVTVAARKAADRARAAEMGFEACAIDELSEYVQSMAFIFNTVPAPVLTGPVLANARQCFVLVDIASGGGTDFQAAAGYGLKAILAPGLPGKVAPVTSGKILARVYPRFLGKFGLRGGEH